MTTPVACLCVALSVSASAQNAGKPQVPDFSGFWQHGVAQEEYENSPAGGPGPVHNIAGHPHWEGDATNPVLQPWAAAQVKRNADSFVAGNEIHTAQELCMMAGVPNIMTFLGPVQFLQSPTNVAIIYQRDHQVRTIALDQKHSAHPAPSWYGESVGHYEGDTLVVDTIGLNDKTWTDRFGTPHSDALHVVERFRIVGGRTLEVSFDVDDPKAFTSPWSGVVKYQPARGPWEEEICAENNFDAVTKKSFPIPTAAKADF